MQLDITETQIQQIKEENPGNLDAQAFEMLKIWRVQKKELASGTVFTDAFIVCKTELSNTKLSNTLVNFFVSNSKSRGLEKRNCLFFNIRFLHQIELRKDYVIYVLYFHFNFKAILWKRPSEGSTEMILCVTRCTMLNL